MRYTFDPRRSKWFRSSVYNNNVYVGDKQLRLNEPIELTDEERDCAESLYPGGLEPFEEAVATDPAVVDSSTGGKSKSKKPTAAQRNQVVDQLKAGGLDQAMLESILNDYADDTEIMSLVETAMSGL